MANSASFNPANPYKSLVHFTEMAEILPTEIKIRSLDQVEAFFSEKAYENASIPMDTDNQERFCVFEAKHLWRTAKSIMLPRRKHRICQLLANLIKVAGIGGKELDLPKSLYLMTVQHNGECYHGWIDGRFVQSSQLLQKCVKGSTVKIEPPCHVKPSVLFALQRLHSYRDSHCHLESQMDLTFEMFFDLVIFASEWNILPLKVRLTTIFKALHIAQRTPEVIEEFKKAQQKFDQAHLKDCLQEISFNLDGELVNSDGCPMHNEVRGQISPKRAECLEGGSRWFDAQNPFKSIAHYLQHCTALSTEQQKRFQNDVCLFFTHAAYKGEIAVIPAALQSSFVKIDLQFLLDTMQTETWERDRFLATVQIVTKRSFPRQPPSDRLRIVYNTYGGQNHKQSGWVKDSTSLVPLEIETSVPLLFSDVKPFHGTEQQIVAMLNAGFEYAQMGFIEKARKEIIEAFKSEKLRATFSTELAKHLYRAALQKFLRSNNIGLVRVNRYELNENQLYHYFVYILTPEKPFLDQVEEHLGRSPHRSNVILRLQADDLPKNLVEEWVAYKGKLLKEKPSPFAKVEDLG